MTTAARKTRRECKPGEFFVTYEDRRPSTKQWGETVRITSRKWAVCRAAAIGYSVVTRCATEEAALAKAAALAA